VPPRAFRDVTLAPVVDGLTKVTLPMTDRVRVSTASGYLAAQAQIETGARGNPGTP